VADWKERAIVALREARVYVMDASMAAEARHDRRGEDYLDAEQYAIMKETEALIERIDDLLLEGES
jgi:predicted nucleic acid-binding protein